MKNEEEFVIELLEELNSIYIDSRYPGDIGLLPSGPPSKSRAKLTFDKNTQLFSHFENYYSKP